MPLDYSHQLDILKDILTNHQIDCCGTVSECEQLERLVHSLLSNSNITPEVKQVLQEIQYYSQTGKSTQELDTHITSHQNQLSQWVTDIEQLS